MIKKILWVFFEKGSLTLIQFVSIVVLGRLLTPEDYGIYGIMMFFIYIIETLVDSGFGGALVQKRTIDSKDIDTLFLVNASISVFLYGILFLVAPIIESYYNIPKLSLYFRVIGLSVLFYAASIVQNALIMRDMRFKLSANVNLFSCVISTSISILLAYYGFGVWALIIQVLLQSFLISLLLWLVNKIHIGRDFSKESFKFFWNFGVNILGANLFASFVNNISNSLIPKIGTLQQSGYYVQASKISSVPTNILALSIDKSIFPILSRETNIDALLNKGRRINNLFIIVFLPFFPLISLTSYPLIRVVLGEQWLDAAPYLSVLIWGGIGLLLQSLFRNIFKSSGDTKSIFFIEIIKSSIVLLIILVSISKGVLFLVYGVMISAFVGACIWGVFLNYRLKYPLRYIIGDFLKPLVSVAVMYFFLLLLFRDFHTYVSFISIPLGYLIYIVINIALKNDATIFAYNKFKSFILYNKNK